MIDVSNLIIYSVAKCIPTHVKIIFIFIVGINKIMPNINARVNSITRGTNIFFNTYTKNHVPHFSLNL